MGLVSSGAAQYISIRTAALCRDVVYQLSEAFFLITQQALAPQLQHSLYKDLCGFVRVTHEGSRYSVEIELPYLYPARREECDGVGG